ncbi:hypothetical protein C2845_PM13G07410 [Panicum miliaceum]|uniref:Uncharacterized protein n=1 Tax=Panicum miliaceum TaxID=4540 RepID=A0A3L6RIP3_PANMI|nr:hypothetical protein C2845_PM13G07410 [Panicum miliaceum]
MAHKFSISRESSWWTDADSRSWSKTTKGLLGRGSNSHKSGDGRSFDERSSDSSSLRIEVSNPSRKAGSDDVNGDIRITVSSGFCSG